MNKHTPTPWRIFTTTDGRKLVGIGGQDGQGVLDAGFGVWSWNDPEGIANAHLVVRAVNAHDALVEALEAAQWGIINRCPVCAGWNMSPNGETDKVHTPTCIVATALKLAKGKDAE